MTRLRCVHATATTATTITNTTTTTKTAITKTATGMCLTVGGTGSTQM